MKYPGVLLLLLLCNALAAQGKVRTIEGIFSLGNAHKDGYELNGQHFDLPTNVAAECDNKKVKITGRVTQHPHVIHKKKNAKPGNEIQGRFEVYPAKNDTGGVEMKTRLVSIGTTFSITSVSVWDSAKAEWKLIYNAKKKSEI